MDDGFKWFGEGFDGFPKRLPDDCVEYIIYVVDENLKTPAATRTRLGEIARAAEKVKKELLRDYIWQREEFGLGMYPRPLDKSEVGGENDNNNSSHNHSNNANHDSTRGPPRLRGRTNFGDSIADEWLIVYLLLELSKQFPSAWMRVYDTDGEFLLIEAASALPKWLSPDIAENRVWLNNGHLRLIGPESKASSSSSSNLTLTRALSIIQTQPSTLLISPFVEDEAFHRIASYPSSIISANLHRALITIPRRLAHLLHHQPRAVSPAIEAFYLRDPLSLRPLATKDISTLHLPPEDFVTTSVSFPKTGYAQLRSQHFGPPPAWTGVAPRMRHASAEMGMKLTCGFEMWLRDYPHGPNLLPWARRLADEARLVLAEIDAGEEQLPSDGEVGAWPRTQDDEAWLDIDYAEFEAELGGRKDGKDGKRDAETEVEGKRGGKVGFGDEAAQRNLRRMVAKFEDFLDDDDAGVHGVDENDDYDDDDVEEEEDTEPDSDDVVDEREFETAMKHVMGLQAEDKEKSGLLEEARRLAIEDAELQSDVDEDEEMKKVMDLMEGELKGHGALKLDPQNGTPPVRSGQEKNQAKKNKKSNTPQKPFFGPPRPPGMKTDSALTLAHSDEEEDVEELERGHGESSSDDQEFNDVDLGLAKNMLESFKGQAGMAGPAGNMMRAMGVNMPRDEGSESE